jgi:Arc/MetJ-type ribon-helix-helix transcriptional regulator
MEIHPTPDQEALIREAVSAGRFACPEDAIGEALALWEERERARAEFRATLDEAEASLAGGEGIDITPSAMQALIDNINDHTRVRLAAEPEASG